MDFSEYKFLVYSDLYRVAGKLTLRSLLWHIAVGGSFKYNFWMRTCAYAKSQTISKIIIFPFARLLLRHQQYKLGISIPSSTKIGGGFYIGHFGGIVVNSNCTIGKNCNISQGVTLGKANRGKRKGYPVVGNSVYIGPGAKIIGAVVIGNNVAIGANCVVTRDIPDNAVVVGIPGRIISSHGSEGYINRTDYEDKIAYAVRTAS